MSTRKLNALLLLLGLSLPAMAQSVDYSVVAVGEESGLDFKKITSDNDCLCMPEVKRRGKKITWWSGRVIAMQGRRIKLRCPPKVLTGTLHPSLPSIFSG